MAAPGSTANFAQMTTSTGGTGALTLSTVANYPSFTDKFGSGSTLVQYVAEATDLFEAGTAWYDGTTSVLSSRTVIESWDGAAYGTSAVNFPASPVTVSCRPITQSAADASIVRETVTYYVCPSGQTTANYDGDALNTAVTPSDSNDGLTKATPLATIAAAAAKVAGKVLLAPVVIQLADTDATKAYFPDGVIIEPACLGGSTNVFDVALMSEADKYPTSYVHIKGNTSTPNNVAVVGATTYNGTTPSAKHAFICGGSNLRVQGMHFKYFASDCIAGNNRALVIVETCNGTQLSSYTGYDQDGLVHVSNQSHAKLAGAMTMTNCQLVNADNSTVEFFSPLGYLTLTFTSSGASYPQFAILADEKSHIYIEGLTATFSGTGTYYCFAALVGSTINWNSDIATSVTINGANISMHKARQGGMIFEAVGGTGQTGTFTSMYRRAYASEGSLICYGGTTAGTQADYCDGGSKILNGTFPYTWKLSSTLEGYQEFKEIAAPSSAGTNILRLYAKDDGAGVTRLYYKNSAGTEYGPLDAAGSGYAALASANTFTAAQTLQTSGVQKPLELIRTDTGQQQISATGGGSNAWESFVFNANRHRGTYAAQSAVSSGDDILTFNGAVWGSGAGSSATYNSAGQFLLEADGTSTSTSSPGRWVFTTTPSGSTSNAIRLTIYANGDAVLGSAALATSATAGFLFINGGPGKPTGTPTTYSGRTALYVDTTNYQLYMYVGSAWRQVRGETAVTLTDAATVTIDATTGAKSFKLSTAASRTLGAPGAGYDGQEITIRIKNTAAGSITPVATTGSSNAFRFSATPSALSAIAAGTTRYIRAVYNSDDSRWDVTHESGEF